MFDSEPWRVRALLPIDSGLVKSTIETLEDNRVKVSVEVDESEFDTAVDAAFKRIAREVRMPGFRPGKAPRRILEAQLGHQVGREEALREALPDYYARAVVEHDIDVIASPEIKITSGEESGPVVFDALVQIRPVVNAAGYDGLRVEIPKPVPSDEDIDEQVDAMRAQFAELEPVERPAADGDHVTIDISGSHEGEEVPGLTTTDYDYEVGSGAVVAEIDDNLRGASAGDEVEFDAAHPDPDEEGALHFSVAVKEVKEAVLPDLDDEWASKASEFDTVEELRADLVKRLTAMKISQARMAVQQNTGEALAGLVDAEIPDALIDSEINARIQEFVNRLQQQGADVTQYLESIGMTGESLAEQFREPAEQAVRVDLALRYVAEAESLVPDDAAVSEAISEMATEAGQDATELEQKLAEFGQLSALRADLGKQKALEWLTENVELVDGDGAIIERSALEFPTTDPDGDSVTVSSEDSTEDDSAEDEK